MGRYFTRNARLDPIEAISSIKQWSFPFSEPSDIQPLLDKIGDASIVMLGEASHGTHEYYTWRSYITKRLIEEKGFNFIAVEGDWPDCYRVNRFIKGLDTSPRSAFNVLHEFRRWPTWMWANWEIVALVEWLKEFNNGKAKNSKIGFYGLDVYSLWESLDSIKKYLEKTDPAALKIAEEAFECFEPYRKGEGSAYARATQFVPELCQQEVVQMLKEIRARSSHYNTDHENVFSAEQNARIAVNAERYYRTMIKGGPHSWNLRDRHMEDTLNSLLEFYGDNSKTIIWEHNTHIGDARATDMAEEGMYNIGELARIEHADKGVFLLGFGSYKGTVMAGKSWGAPMRTMNLPPARENSWEWILHEAGPGDKLLMMDDIMNDNYMENRIDHRAVGVVYDPQYEKYGNYVPSILPLRYDAFVFLDETRALFPLHIHPDGSQVPETYPFGV